jgi:hypothetical protein
MSKPIVAPATNCSRVGHWGSVLLGIACLGSGLWFAIGVSVNLDFIHVNHMKSWPLQVIIEIGIAMMLMCLGPWCLLQGIRSSIRHK